MYTAEEYESVLNAMFEAHNNYGCGFYNEDIWLKEYNKLSNMCGASQSIMEKALKKEIAEYRENADKYLQIIRDKSKRIKELENGVI